MFYSAQPQLKADDVSYGEFRTAFIDRFNDKHTDHYHYARVQNASQKKNESPEVFLERLRKLCQRTIRSSNNPVEQTVINQEAEEKASGTEDRGTYAKVFTVGGSRGGIPGERVGNRYEKPRGKIPMERESRCRVSA